MIRSVLTFIFATICFSLFATDYERFEQNGKFGLKDEQGAIILPASFDALGWSDGNFSVIGQITGYRQNNQWGLLNLKKEFITKADYSSLTWPGGDRIIVSKAINHFTIKFGSINLEGKTVIPFLYDAISFHGLRAIVMVKSGARYEYGLIDLDDHTIVPVQYKKITPIGTLRYAVEDFSGKIALCSEQGKWVTDFVIDEISDFHHDLAIIHNGWKQGVIDRNGEIKIQPSYRSILIISPDKLSVRKADEWKLLDADFREIQHASADELSFGTNEFYKISVAGKEGIVDNNLSSRWPLEYDHIQLLPNHQVIVKKNGKVGLYRINQTTILPLVFDSLRVQNNFVRGLQRAGGRSAWQLYDTFGIKKSSKDYEVIADYNGNFFPVKNKGYWGAVDRYGKEKIACVYDSLLDVNDSLVTVLFKGLYGIITTEDQWRLVPQRNSIQLLANNHYLERQDSLVYLKDSRGTTLYFTDESFSVFEDHLLEVLADGTQKEVSLQGQIISRKDANALPGELTFRESEGFIGIKRDGKFGFVDKRGRLRIANRYEAIGEFHEGLTAIKLLGKWGYINASDQIVIQPTYQSAGNFDHHIAQVSRKGKRGLINLDGKEILELRYDSIKALPNQLFLITLNSLKGLANSDGRMLIEPRFESLTVIGNEVLVLQNKKYGVLTMEGLSLLPIQYASIIYLPEKKNFLVQQKSLWETLEIKE
ncbi:hypothetical protein BH09BAC3_BH09BAC3_07090 [soil metagenome]